MENTDSPFTLPVLSGLAKRLESAFRKALFDFEMLKDVNKVAVALSGGKDSLTLLLLLKAISGRGFPELDLHAIHVTGEFSCGAGVDEAYLHSICEEMKIPLTICQSTQKRESLECYSCSRERRRLLFNAATSKGFQTIAFGHHRDDHAQTVLMNLLHKGEFAGNLPKIFMRHYGITTIRPLIYINEEEIRTFAKQQGFARIVCQCPVGQNSMRKQVDQLLNDIEAIFPNARENIAQAGLIYGSQKAASP
jgi:tRNA 2-thiocytidine biosynthesis protein TtcA